MNKSILNQQLDETANAIRHAHVGEAVVQAAATRVRAKLINELAAQTSALAETGVPMAEHLRNCHDFQSLIPAYLDGTLSSARTLLLEDHSRECVPCRKALKTARQGAAVQVAPLAPMKGAPVRKDMFAWLKLPALQTAGVRYALAAALVLAFGVFAWPHLAVWLGFGNFGAVVQASNGGVFRVLENRIEPLPQAAQLARGERLRTAKDASAVVKLADGSLIEARERSEFAVNQTGAGTTINLERGAIIVQATKPSGSAKLYVATPDSLVEVQGTTFAVNSGTKGSRISVVEGELNVARGGATPRLLRAGEQAVTHASIAPIPVKDEIAWSRDAARYQETLANVRRAIDAQVVMPGNRFSTRLLDLMPEATMLYVAIPNLTQTLGQANAILEQQLQANPELRAWYEQEARPPNQTNAKQHLEMVLAKVSSFGRFLGQEIAVGVSDKGLNQSGAHVLALAELNDAMGFQQTLEAELAQMPSEARTHLALVADPLTATQNVKANEQLFVWVKQDLLAVANDLATLRTLALAQKANVGARANATAFHARLAEVYREGAGFVIGADVERFIARNLAASKHREQEAAILSSLGITNLKHFIAEMKDLNGVPQNRAVVTFNERQQQGIASWLAAPGPMGALQFISPDANLVGGFVVANPTALYDNLINTLKTADSKAWEHINEIETQHGINLREDFAAKLGGEFAAALDGPVLPTPAWKVVIEVNNPAGLQQSLERTVTALNAEIAKHNGGQLTWENAQSGERTFYRLKATSAAGGAGEVNYTFAYGYLIVAPSRALVENALKYRESGNTLLQAAKFKAALPSDRQANFSALMFYDLAPVLEPLSKKLGNEVTTGQPAHQPLAALRKLAGQKAMLGYAYSFGDRFVFSLNTEDGALALTPSTFLGNDGPFALLKAIAHE